MKLIFMGTPDFAVGILEKLLDEKMDVVAVVTAPDRPAGRGLQLNESAVKVCAVKQNIPVLQPLNLKDESFLSELRSFSADLFVVVAFRMLPELVWNMPPKGTINLHASLLPNYRGAAPINWAIINGETRTGVTTFFIEKEIDTGMVIERKEIGIGENETAGELHDRLLELGKELVHQSVLKIESGAVARTAQEDLISGKRILPAPKIFKPMCQVDWNKNLNEVYDLCRGLSPYPTAWTLIEHKESKELKSVKIFTCRKTDLIVGNQQELKSTKTELLIPCRDFYLSVTELQPEGKRRMKSSEFLLGYEIGKWKIS